MAKAEKEEVVVRSSLRTPEPAYPLQSRPPRVGFSSSWLVQAVLVVLVIDVALSTLRGLDFVRYMFVGSRLAVVAMVLWLGLSALSLFLFSRFRNWAGERFPRRGWAVATVIYAYLLFALVFGLTLEYLAGLIDVDWLETGGDEPNHVFTAVGLTITGAALVMTSLTIRAVEKMRRANEQPSDSSPDPGSDSGRDGRKMDLDEDSP